MAEHGVQPGVRTAISGAVRGERVTRPSAGTGAEQAAADFERGYHLLVQANPQPMWVHDRSSLTFLEVNDAMIRRYGYTREELVSMTVAAIAAEHDREALCRAASGEEAIDRSGPWQHVTATGEVVEVELTSYPVAFQGHDAACVLVHDVTERRRLEHVLGQAERLESLGTLAGGLAHDFNNLMAVVLGYARFVRRSVESAAATPGGSAWQGVVADVDQITDAAERAAVLVRQLLAFARRQVTQPEVTDVDGVVAEVRDLLARSAGEHVELEVRLDGGRWTVLVDRRQLEQVLVNLAANAGDAMPAGGRLTVETSCLASSGGAAAPVPGLEPGRYVVLRVTDTGRGMDADTMAHAFDPFFTTKPDGLGTGLGLSTVHGIVAQAGGRVHLDSRPGHGTTVTVVLPALDDVVLTATPVLLSAAASPPACGEAR